MLVKFRCRTCFAKVAADDDVIGKEVNCPSCNALFLVPQPQFGFGKVLGGYEIEQSLGSGAMGEVYLAKQLSMNRPVALKVIKHDISMDREVVERFTFEAQTLARLNHPNIVPAFDAGHTDDCYYMAMGFIDGETLEDNLKRNGPSDEVELLEIGLKVVSALEYAWGEFKLLHRDIKPANIMLDQMGEVRIMDMGIAKSTVDDGGLTRVGLVVGTPFYMSPEQAQASVGIDYKSDIYALAATMYQMLTGVLPFQGPNVMSILAKKVNSPVIPPHEIKPYLSVETSTLLVRLLHFVPSKRFEDFAELRRLLGECLTVAKRNKEKSSKVVKTKFIKVPEEVIQAKTEKMKQSQNLAAMKKPANNKLVLVALASVIVVLLVVLLLLNPAKSPVAPVEESAVAVLKVDQSGLSEMFEDPQEKVSSLSNARDENLSDLEFAKKYLKYNINSAGQIGYENVEARGAASINAIGRLSFEKGAYLDQYLSDDFHESFTENGGFTVRLSFLGEEESLMKTGVIASYGQDMKNFNFRILQKNGEVYLELRQMKGLKPFVNSIPLFKANTELNHLVVSYRSGKLLVMKNNLKVLDKRYSGVIEDWSKYPLSFGDNFDGPHQFWQGQILKFFLYSSFAGKERLHSFGGKPLGRKGDKKRRF